VFGKRDPKSGESPDRPVLLAASNSFEGIQKEYQTLSELFGRRDKDWKLVSRTTLSHNGRTLEKFEVSHRGKRKAIYFDITSWLAGNQEAQFSPVGLLADQTLSDFMVEARIRADVATLFPVSLLSLNDSQLAQVHFPIEDRNAVLDAFLSKAEHAAGLVEKGPPYEHVRILLSAKRWALVSHLVRSIDVSNHHLQTMVEELRFAIEGAMKEAISKLRRD